MLKCKDVSEHASSYIDQSLPWHQRMGLIFHLALCNNCRRFVRHLKVTIKIGSVIGRKELANAEAQIIAQQAIQEQK